MGMGYDPDTPYLLKWAAIMGLEGTSFSDQRRLLIALGWIVPYRYRDGHKIVKPLVSNLTPPLFLLILFFTSLNQKLSSSLELGSLW